MEFDKFYSVVRRLGGGAFGEVFLIQSKLDGMQYAAKRSKVDDSVTEAFIREYSLMNYIGGERGVLHIEDVIVDSDYNWLILPVEDEDLHVMIERTTKWTVERLRYYMRQMLLTLQYIHSNGVMHRDIKPENILHNVRSDKLFLADFGIATRFVLPQGGNFYPHVVTRWYRAPELLRANIDDLDVLHYGPAIDIWAMGCVFGEMVARTPPVEGANDTLQLSGIEELLKRFDIRAKRWINTTCSAWRPVEKAELLDLLRAMLTEDPAKRPSARELLDYPFLQTQNVMDLTYDVGDVFVAENTPILPQPWLLTASADIKVARSILLNWILSVSFSFRLTFTTFCRTVYIVDGYMARHDVPLARIQLYGGMASLIASNLEEDTQPRITDYRYMMAQAYTEKESFDAEREMLDQALPNELVGPVIADFERPNEFMARYLSSLLLCYGYDILLSTKVTPFVADIITQRMAAEIAAGEQVVVTADSLEYQIQQLVVPHQTGDLNSVYAYYQRRYPDIINSWKPIYVLA